MDKEEICRQFNLVAKEYDVNRRKFIPYYDAFYEKTTDFISCCIAPPKNILDLGAGTGLLTSFWYNHYPETSYTLVDIAPEMLSVARKRFAGLNNICYTVQDYTNSLPTRDYDAIISALSIGVTSDSQISFV